MSNIRVMSIGSDCTTADVFKKLGMRESGPVDWAYVDNSLFHIGNLLSGCMLDSLLNKQWKSKYGYYVGMEDINSNQYQFQLGEYNYIHEILTDKEEYKKLLYRFLKLDRELRTINDSNFYLAYSLNEEDKDTYDVTNLLGLFKILNIDINHVIFIASNRTHSNIISSNVPNYILIPEWDKYWYSESNKTTVVNKVRDELRAFLNV